MPDQSRFGFTWLAPLLLAAAAWAQDGAKTAPDRLQALLQELAGLDLGAWAARIGALEQQAKSHDAQAAELRGQAARLQQQAAEAEAAAKAVRGEIERLRQVQKLVGAPMPAKPASAPVASRPAASRPAVEKTGAPKPDQAMAATSAPTKAAGELITWDRQVARILGDHCGACHDPIDKKGGFDVSTFASARQGGGSGRTIVPGDPEQSRLYRLISQQERPFMPKDGDPLPADVVGKLKRWIEQGAAEDAEAARAFLAAKEAAAKTGAAGAPAGTAPGASPMPVDLPAVPLHPAARASATRSLARSPRAPLLALPGLQQVLLFDAQMRSLGILPCPLPHIESVAFAADGTVLLAAGGEAGRRGEVVLYDVRTGAQRGTFGSERDLPLAAAVHPAAGLVALGGSGKQVHVHAIADGSESFAGKHEDFVLALDFAPDGRLLAAGDRAGTVQLWETAGGRIGQTLSGHRGAVNALAFESGGRQLATAGADGTVRMWNVAEGKELWRQPAHQGEALAVAFGPGDVLATAGSDGLVKLWTKSGTAVATSPAAGEWLYAVAFGADADVVYAGDWQGRVHRFSVKEKQMRVVATPLVSQ